MRWWSELDRVAELSAPGSRAATEHIPDIDVFSDERSELISERLKRYGHGWDVSS